jgi:FkbM family methyltransferase
MAQALGQDRAFEIGGIGDQSSCGGRRVIRTMVGSIKHLMHKTFHFFGFEIMSIRNIHTALECRDKERKIRSFKWLADMGNFHVLDIGANTGQFASEIHEILPSAVIHSFEPVPHVFEELTRNLIVIPGAKAYNVGVGAADGQMTIYINEFTPASSLLSMTPQHRNEFVLRVPEITKKGFQAIVPVRRLDDLATEIGISAPYMVKIDTEGYELKVITGGVNTLRNAEVVILETSFYELYKDQGLFGEIHEAMRTLGFYYAGPFDVILSARDGLILIQDSIFLPERYSRRRKEIRSGFDE